MIGRACPASSTRARTAGSLVATIGASRAPSLCPTSPMRLTSISGRVRRSARPARMSSTNSKWVVPLRSPSIRRPPGRPSGALRSRAGRGSRRSRGTAGNHRTRVLVPVLWAGAADGDDHRDGMGPARALGEGEGPGEGVAHRRRHSDGFGGVGRPGGRCSPAPVPRPPGRRRRAQGRARRRRHERGGGGNTDRTLEGPREQDGRNRTWGYQWYVDTLVCGFAGPMPRAAGPVLAETTKV